VGDDSAAIAAGPRSSAAGRWDSVVGALACSTAGSPASTGSAAGARARAPRQGLSFQPEAGPGGPRVGDSRSHSCEAPGAAHATSVHTCASLLGRGVVENNA